MTVFEIARPMYHATDSTESRSSLKASDVVAINRIIRPGSLSDHEIRALPFLAQVDVTVEIIH